MKNKTLNAIITWIICTLLIVSLGLLSFFSETAIPWVASIGGLVVLIGLGMEECTEVELFKNSEHLKKSKKHEKAGRFLVMLGVGIEILVGFGIAAHDVSETKKISDNVNRIDPTNLPVLNINAFVKIRVKGSIFPDLTQWDSIPISKNWGSETSVAKLCDNGPNSVLQSIPFMVSDDFGKGTELSDSREYFLNFHVESVSAAMKLPLKSASKSFSAANFISLDVRFLPPQSEILDGYAFVVVNNSLWKLFRIYPQKDTQPPFPNKEMSEIISKNGLTNVFENFVVSGSKGMDAGVKISAWEPGKLTSISNGEMFPAGGGFFWAECTIIGTNVPSGNFDQNW
jgi:hypothetical protein